MHIFLALLANCSVPSRRSCVSSFDKHPMVIIMTFGAVTQPGLWTAVFPGTGMHGASPLSPDSDELRGEVKKQFESENAGRCQGFRMIAQSSGSEAPVCSDPGPINIWASEVACQT
ncbi:unnamed protein product [Lota lota]